jgi:hypothetical protein
MACDKLQTKLAMSTAFHPQTDGQTERANRTLEDMLRSYVNVRHDNWDEHLAMLEFAVNNAKNESTGYSPFFMTYGRHPCGPLDRAIQDATATSSVCEAGANIAAEEFFQNIHSALETAKVKLKKAQEHQAKYANKHRRECTFQEGESVLLSSEDIRFRQSDTSRKKFEPTDFGPFRIILKLSDHNYQLDLPASMSRTHPVFHVSKLRPYVPVDVVRFPSQPAPSCPPPEIVEGEPHYEVEEIVAKRTVRLRGGAEQLQYRVMWKGYPATESTWEPLDHLHNAQDCIAAYEQGRTGRNGIN